MIQKGGREVRREMEQLKHGHRDLKELWKCRGRILGLDIKAIVSICVRTMMNVILTQREMSDICSSSTLTKIECIRAVDAELRRGLLEMIPLIVI